MNDMIGKEIKFRATGASYGIAIGKAAIIHSRAYSYDMLEEKFITTSEVDREIERFKEALRSTRKEMVDMQRQFRDKFGSREVDIFDAHLMIVDDQMLNNEVIDRIRRENLSAETAYKRTISRYVTALMTMADNYIRERTDDIRDVASRIINHLSVPERVFPVIPEGEPRIVVAVDLTPSETALFNREQIFGMAVVTGSTTSHTAILARSMRLPALVGLPHEAYEMIKEAVDPVVIIDGNIGEIIINPSQSTLDVYHEHIAEGKEFEKQIDAEKNLPAQTVDGFQIKLLCNLGGSSEIDSVINSGAGGVGLFRTEYMFINAKKLPSEEEQYQIYRDLALRLPNQPLVIRTLDIGGDKLESQIDAIAEANPFLGLRAIRLCLHSRQDIFRTQLRAILRASVHGDIRIMYPMISCVEEVREINELMEKLKQELTVEGIEFNHNLKTGIMIEVPAAALVAHSLAPLVNFFSIGTNDLIQYTIAIDRTNDRVSYLYQPTHPAVLELIQRTVAAGREHNIETSICGEIAGNPLYTPLLVGMGINELSMSPGLVGVIRRVIRSLDKREAEAAVAEALRGNTAEDAMKISTALLHKAVPDIAELAILHY